MPFIVFDHKNVTSFDIPEEARSEMIARIDRDYPPYVTAVPSIYDVVSRNCYNGVDECTNYLSTFGQSKAAQSVALDDVSAETAPAETTVEVTAEAAAHEETAPKQETANVETLSVSVVEGEDTQGTASSVPQEVPEPPKKKTTRRRKVTVQA